MDGKGRNGSFIFIELCDPLAQVTKLNYLLEAVPLLDPFQLLDR